MLLLCSGGRRLLLRRPVLDIRDVTVDSGDRNSPTRLRLSILETQRHQWAECEALHTASALITKDLEPPRLSKWTSSSSSCTAPLLHPEIFEFFQFHVQCHVLETSSTRPLAHWDASTHCPAVSSHGLTLTCYTHFTRRLQEKNQNMSTDTDSDICPHRQNLQNMWGTCEEHVRNMSGACQEHVRNMSGACQEHVRSMSGACQETC